MELKLKQASAVLGMPPKELQNLVQFGVVQPKRRRGLCIFDTNALYEAQVAEYFKTALGTRTDRLADLVQAFSKYLKNRQANTPDVVVFTLEMPSSLKITLPLKQLTETLQARLQRIELYRDLPRGRKRPGWKQQFLETLKEAAEDLGDVSPEEITRTVRKYRKSRKQKPEITVVDETAQA